MLPFKNRLSKKKDFEKIFQKGKGFKIDFLYLKYLNNNLDYNRFGFVVSKKIAKKAVIRNQIKRELKREIKENPIKNKETKDIILIVLKKPEEIKKTITKALKLLCEN